MTKLSEPLERLMIRDLPRQLDRAVRPFDAITITEGAAARGRPSALRVVAASAMVAIAAVAAIIAIEGFSSVVRQPGSQPAPGSSAPESTPRAASQDSLAAALEADALLSTRLTGGENAFVVHAHGEVVERCMQELGWDYELAPVIAEGEPYPYPGSLSDLRQWTFADVEAAGSVGYGLQAHLGDIAAAIEAMDAGDRVSIPEPLSMRPEDAARFELDFFGTEEERIEILERDGSHAGKAGGGCMGEADRTLHGDIEREMWLRDARGTASSDIWVAVKADGAVADALKSWIDCLGSRGVEFTDPGRAYAAALEVAASGDFAEERRIATAHAECAVESNLHRVVATAFASVANAVLPGLQGDLIALQQLEAGAVGRAKDVLGVGE